MMFYRLSKLIFLLVTEKNDFSFLQLILLLEKNGVDVHSLKSIPFIEIHLFEREKERDLFIKSVILVDEQ